MPDETVVRKVNQGRVYKAILKLIQRSPLAASSRRNRGATARDHPHDYISGLNIDVATWNVRQELPA